MTTATDTGAIRTQVGRAHLLLSRESQ
jgi:hypothetical protein